jgi:methylthioribose-1-phosphate isomerase
MLESKINAVEWKNGELVLLDQRALPKSESYIVCSDIAGVIDAIKTMVVRGAPAIGIVAAYGVVISAESHKRLNSQAVLLDTYKSAVIADLERLSESRPTAVNLAWAVDRMRRCFNTHMTSENLVEILLLEAKSIHDEDIANNYKMARLASDWMAGSTRSPFSILTHCNTGSLATGGYGTALGAVRMAWKNKLIDCVYADETRPWLQGARLTAWELARDNIPVVLNADGAAGWLLANKDIEWIIVGADRITANGDVANKIGTYGLAVLAKYHGVKMMVVAPSSTVDMDLASGNDIEIEMRTGKELTEISGLQIAPDNIDTINPVFDITPAALIDVIVTEKGLIENPSLEAMSAIFK